MNWIVLLESPPRQGPFQRGYVPQRFREKAKAERFMAQVT